MAKGKSNFKHTAQTNGKKWKAIFTDPQEEPRHLRDFVEKEHAHFYLASYKIAYKLLKDHEKAKAFMDLPNLNFGGASPLALIVSYRGHKVLKFCEVAEEESKPLSES